MSGSFNQFLGPLAQMLGLIEGSGGGVFPALLAQLENAGLGDTVRSWVGHGENTPVTAEELGRAFTPEQLNDWAAQAGTDPDTLLAQMARELPDAVHRATPDGVVPSRSDDA